MGIILGEELATPFQLIRHALSGWLTRAPQFKVLGTVIIFDTVDMVDVLMRIKRSAEFALHNMPMLQNPPTPNRNNAISLLV